MHLSTSLAVLLAATLTGCSTLNVDSSGRLSDYHSVVAVDETTGLRTRAATTDLSGYRSLFIAPVIVAPAEKTGEMRVTADEQAALAAFFTQELAQAFGERFVIVSAPSVDALTLRAVITDVDPVNPTLNGATLVLLGLPADGGGAAIEMEIVDPAGVQVAATVGAVKGKPFAFKKAFRRMAHAESALSAAVTTLRQQIGNP